MSVRLGSALSTFAVIALVIACDNGGGGAQDPGTQPGGGGPPARVAQPQPIQAVFTQADFTTVYTVTAANPDSDELVFAWAGPNCGPFFPEGVTCNTPSCTSKLQWVHPHPPCSNDTQHSDATIVLQVAGKRSGRTVTCTYQGAETGTGPACFQSGFNGSEVGPDTNFARIRYRLGAGKKCSRIEMVQVISIFKKGPPDTIVIPHNDGMIDPGGNILGYQLPAVEDDVGGYVVDKFKNDLTSEDPYYPGSVPGTATTDAELDDRPDNTKPGHRSYYEVCAFCAGNPTDADFGKYLDCFTWELDGDTRTARKTEPQPPQKPTPGFGAAVDKWNQNKRFKMPGSK